MISAKGPWHLSGGQRRIGSAIRGCEACDYHCDGKKHQANVDNHLDALNSTSKFTGGNKASCACRTERANGKVQRIQSRETSVEIWRTSIAPVNKREAAYKYGKVAK